MMAQIYLGHDCAIRNGLMAQVSHRVLQTVLASPPAVCRSHTVGGVADSAAKA
jgi:hypothetical protein